ncbi:MAG: LON peptidase substrate-binding domain-containing protein [Phycisphaerales bacterium JB050]
MEEHETIRVNFSKPHPIFPLSGVTLLPHAIAALYIFEPRYRQMVKDVLDTTGQIAMATYDDSIKTDESPRPIRPVVCLGQIVQHERHPDGTYHIFLQGICRAEVIEQIDPDPDAIGGKLYRQALLQPLKGEDEHEGIEIDAQRDELTGLLESERLSTLPAVQQVRKQLASGFEVLPTPVLMDVVALSLLSVVDEQKLRNALLEEPSATKRADLMIRELKRIDHTLRLAELQFDPEAPKGISWN